MKRKTLNVRGELDYDFKNDMLFFKAKNREYAKSIESGNIVFDMDSEGYISGMQIMEASKFLELDKKELLKIPKWKLSAAISGNRIIVRLDFKVMQRNMEIEKSPIIVHFLPESYPDSELVCGIA